MILIEKHWVSNLIDDILGLEVAVDEVALVHICHGVANLRTIQAQDISGQGPKAQGPGPNIAAIAPKPTLCFGFTFDVSRSKVLLLFRASAKFCSDLCVISMHSAAEARQ